MSQLCQSKAPEVFPLLASSLPFQMPLTSEIVKSLVVELQTYSKFCWNLLVMHEWDSEEAVEVLGVSEQLMERNYLLGFIEDSSNFSIYDVYLLLSSHDSVSLSSGSKEMFILINLSEFALQVSNLLTLMKDCLDLFQVQIC